MKKFISITLAVLLSALLFSTCCSCSDKNESIKFTYDFAITGDADGAVDVTFPGGDLKLDGKTDLDFSWGNVTRNTRFIEVSDLLASDNKETVAIGNAMLASIEENFKAVSGGGTYYLHILITVREELTGLEAKMDKVLTNRKTDPGNGLWSYDY